jgi:hypothetical protein
MTSPLRIWLGGALSAFIDGFIDGCPVGAPAGAGIAAADGKFPTDLGTPGLLIALGHVLLVPVVTGIADVRAWKKDHSFPNIFAPAPAPALNPSTPPTP